MEAAIKLFAAAMELLSQCTGFSQRDVSLDMLEGVAKLRYALLVAAELLQLQVKEMGGDSASHTQILYGRVASRLVESARYCCMYMYIDVSHALHVPCACRRACTEERINTIDTTGKTNTTGPIVYLLKLLVRQAGFSCLKKIVEKPDGKWVVPPGLGRDEVS